MNKKTYSTPEVDIEKFLLNQVIATSDGDLMDTGGDFIGGDEDWDF